MLPFDTENFNVVFSVANRVDQQWPELLGILFTLSNSKEPGQRENAYRIFATTPGIIEKQHEDTVLSAFTRGFKDADVSVSRASQYFLMLAK
jgi:hypothetical protein